MYHFFASVFFPHNFLWSSLLHGSQVLTATQSMNQIHTIDGVRKHRSCESSPFTLIQNNYQTASRCNMCNTEWQ